MKWHSEGSKDLLVYLSESGGCPKTKDVASQILKACGEDKCSMQCNGALDWEGQLLPKYTLFSETGDPIMDIIQCPYHPFLDRSSNIGKMPIVYTLEMILMLVIFMTSLAIIAVPKAIFTCRLRNLSHAVWMAFSCFATIFYIAALLWSLYEVAAGSIEHSLVATITFSITVTMVTLSLLIPSPWMQRVSFKLQGAVTCLRYFMCLSRRKAVLRKLGTLVKEAKEEWGYTRTHLVGYSLGSMVALDSVYPFKSDNIQPQLCDTLITIGCFADMIRLPFPWYYANNRVVQDKPGFVWENIFIPSDALGSNFNASSWSDDTAQIDVNGNIVANTAIRQPGLATNRVYRKGLFGQSRRFDEVQLLIKSFLGLAIFEHARYAFFLDGLHPVFDDFVATKIVEIVFRSGEGSRWIKVPEVNTPNDMTEAEELEVYVPKGGLSVEDFGGTSAPF